jgi:AraC-like DNA-binding protein
MVMPTRFLTDDALPLYRSVQLPAVLVRYARTKGLPVPALLTDTGLKEEDFDDPDFLSTTAQEIVLVRALCTLAEEPDLGLTVGALYHVGVLGPVTTAVMHSDTLGEAIRQAHRYEVLVGSFFQWVISLAGDQVAFVLRERIDLKDVRGVLCEREFTALRRFLNDLVGPAFRFTRLEVAYPSPRHAGAYVEAMGCPVEFNAAEHTLRFDASWLDQPLPLANPLARIVGDRECAKAVSRLRATGSMTERVIQEIVFRDAGVPDLDSLAGRLAMSPRTLRRRLREEGMSYRDIVARLQLDESVRLLQTTTLSVADIAHQVGFNDLPNFYRAFRRWTGTAPGAYREHPASAG